jgi:hypothetical protein
MVKRKADPVFALGGHIKWSVLWIHNGSIRQHLCEDDLNEALRVMRVLEKAGRKGVTLHSDNVGFPPPEKYRPHTVYKRKKVKVLRKGKERWMLKTSERRVVPMKKLNAREWWWCPYCRKMRKFQMQRAFPVEGVVVPEREYGMYCPMCGISHRDFHVRRWNPKAAELYFRMGMTRRSKRARSQRNSGRRRP